MGDNGLVWERGIVMGGVIAGALFIYLIGKLLEWAVLKRIFKAYDNMVWVSAWLVFGLFALAAVAQPDNPGLNAGLIINLLIAAFLLPPLRVFMRNRKAKKAAKAAAASSSSVGV